MHPVHPSITDMTARTRTSDVLRAAQERKSVDRRGARRHRNPARHVGG